jgi:hypothetical protein
LPPCTRRLSPIAAALTLVAAFAPARAAVVNVPPVTITSLRHDFNGSSAQDVIDIPGPGYTSSSFTAAFGTGDVVHVRIEAPPGKKFQVRCPPSSTGAFKVNVYWPCAGGGVSYFNPAVVTFENFRGIPPTLGYNLAAANDVLVEAWYDYTTHGNFEFTAFLVDIPVDQALARVSRTYADVLSWATPSIGAGALTTSPTYKPMEIVNDDTVPVTPASWGRIKSLYR